MAEEIANSLNQLGRPTTVPSSPDAATLETVPNPHPGYRYVVRFACPEFTTLCPITDYVPDACLVESKSLADPGVLPQPPCVQRGRDARRGAPSRGGPEPCAAAHRRLLVPRGGMPIDVFYQTGEPPAGVWLPDQSVPPYRCPG